MSTGTRRGPDIAAFDFLAEDPEHPDGQTDALAEWDPGEEAFRAPGADALYVHYEGGETPDGVHVRSIPRIRSIPRRAVSPPPSGDRCEVEVEGCTYPFPNPGEANAWILQWMRDRPGLTTFPGKARMVGPQPPRPRLRPPRR